MFKAMLLSAAIAAASIQPAQAVDTEEACFVIARLAEAIMKARQNGVPLQNVLGVSKKGESADLRTGLRAIAVEAYRRPRFDTPKYIQSAIDDFRDQIHVECLSSVD